MKKEEKTSLASINEILERAKDPHNSNRFKDLTDAVALMLQDQSFAQLLQKSDKQIQLNTEKDLYSVAFTYLHMFLMQRNYEAAATLLWGPETFTCEPRSVQMVWAGIKDHHLVNILGAASMGKTYSASAWMLLDWILEQLD